MNYNEIFDKYGSDKGTKGNQFGPGHNYGPFYEKWLKNNPPKKMLEIGVADGASLLAWSEIFPNAMIHGLDLFTDGILKNFETSKIKLWKGDQTDKEILHYLRKENFDCVISDGSHNTREEMMAFFGLSQHGMLWFIEDADCENEDFYNQGLPSKFWPSRILADKYSLHYDSKIILIRC